MEQIGFRFEGSDSVKIALIQHVIGVTEGVARPLRSKPQSKIPPKVQASQLNFEFYLDQSQKKEKIA